MTRGPLSSAIADEGIPRIPKTSIPDCWSHCVALTRTSHQYGTPLRKTLRGYWKLRVGDYRVVYKIEGDEV
ncbi:MAG: hypothetical protein OJF51_003884 [Nitrospira sp.]|jgi:mRNA interferase RelE/StbE|nr:MAG: hypothetical protein OJF51_003884 [Nitrospira sp.]